MVPIWIATVFLALVTYYVGQDIPRKEAVSVYATADVSATNFLAYRQAVRGYVAANPAATGTIDDAQLAAYWVPGYIRRAEWTNLVSGGTLYVFSSTVVPRGTVGSLSKKSSESILVGTKSATTGRLQSASGIDTGVNLPAAIAGGALVMMGL